MKFPRNARIFRGQLDAAPFASVFFLLLIFILMGSLQYTPGVRVQLPELPPAEELPGTDQPTIAVAMDKSGRFYFDNRIVGRDELQARLRLAATNSTVPLTLVIQADKEVTEELLVDLIMLARKAGIHDYLVATLPRVFTNPPSLSRHGAP
jgi:biopolymer transport protein ExbD